MIQETVSGAGLSSFAIIGLVLFVAIFLAIAVWILTRSKRQVRTWSELPLAKDRDEPAEPRFENGTSS